MPNYTDPRSTSQAKRLIAMFATAMMLIVGLALVTPTSADAATTSCRGAKGQVSAISDFGFEETYARLAGALETNPAITVIAEIDHAAQAAAAGLTLDPNRVIVFGNPALGSPLMAINPEAGIDLPQKVQVYLQGDAVCVGFNSTTYLQARHGVWQAPTLDTIANALMTITYNVSDSDQQPRRILNNWVRNNDRIITEQSNADFETTWTRLISAIEGSPADVAFTVDHGANSGGVLNPTRLVVFGNPNIGTPVMQARATAGIDLPLKLLVWQADDGTVNVTANDPDLLRRRHRMGSTASTLAPVFGATAAFLSIATTGAPPQ